LTSTQIILTTERTTNYF